MMNLWDATTDERNRDARQAAALRTVLNDSRLLQIRRAHASARPTDRNPAWLNAHRDLGYVLRLLEEAAKV
jgi:hypothetical protein